jgi:AraC-like DNA-binding protein
MTDGAQIVPVAAPAALLPWVVGAWSVEAPDGHEVLTTPDASIDIVLVSNDAFDGVFVCGPLRAYSKRVLRGRTRLIGASLRPGAGALLGVSAGELPPDWIGLDALGLPGARSSPGGAGLAGLFRLIEARAAKARFDWRVAEAIARMRRSRGTLSVAALAREARLSERTLSRLFERHVGMPPAAYSRILRFNRAVMKLRSSGPEGLADVAASLGFADQSHMARDLKELGGLTATQLMRADSLAAPSLACP